MRNGLCLLLLVALLPYAYSQQAKGTSSKFSLEEAIQDAWEQLLPPSEPPAHPDALTRVKIVEMGVESGGIAGVHHLYVIIEQVSEKQQEPKKQAQTKQAQTKQAQTKQAPPSAPSSVTLKRVGEIRSVNYTLSQDKPASLTLTVKAKVNQPGWKNPQLKRRIYHKPPKDGIWEYDFLAHPPKEIRPAAPLLTVPPTLEARDLWVGIDLEKVRGIRVYAANNSKEILLPLRPRWYNKDLSQVPQAEMEILSAKLKKSQLHVQVSYPGGCEPHQFRLYWTKDKTTTMVPEFFLLSHNANNDNCKALIIEDLQFDLSAFPVNEKHWNVTWKNNKLFLNPQK